MDKAVHAGDWSKAFAWSDRALGLGIVHPRLLQIRAIGRERAGRPADAIADLRTASALAPMDTGITNALAVSLSKTGRLDEAKALLSAEAAARPGVAETWSNLAAAEMGLGDLGAARLGYERAVALRPDFPDALGKLALLAAHRGDNAGARIMAERALAVSPDNPDARRAAIEAAIGERRAMDAELAAQDWLKVRTLGPNARSHAMGLLGDALEIQGRHGEAFRAYTASKSAFAQANAGAFRMLESQPLAVTLDAMEREFSTLPAERWASGASDLRDPAGPLTHVFLLGFMRSGTTLLEQALSRHSDVVTLEEIEAMAEAGAAWLGQPGGIDQIAAADEAALQAWRAAYWAAVRKAGVEPRGKVLIDKLPFNGIKLPLIARLFPDAKILFAIRDPRDVVLSCFQKRLQPNGFSYEMRTLEGAARLYAAYMRLARTYRRNLPLAVLDHRHESLLADFETAVAEVCTFIGLDFQPAMTQFQNRAAGGQVMSQTARQLRSGLNNQGLGRWRAYANEMAPALPVLGPWIEAYGYAG